MKIIDIETVGLDPISNQIICIAEGNLENNTINCFYGKDEKKILIDFWNSIQDYEKLVGFNSDGFDIPFIIMRSLIHNIKIKKYKSVDLRKVVNSFFTAYDKYTKGTLSDWAEVLEMNVSTFPGSKMMNLYMEDNWSEILKHNREDVEITKKLYERCVNCELL